MATKSLYAIKQDAKKKTNKNMITDSDYFLRDRSDPKDKRANVIDMTLIEVKPKHQYKQPTKTPKKKTRKWYNEVKTWGINNAKWESAKDWCANRGMEFKILTEDHLNPKYK